MFLKQLLKNNKCSELLLISKQFSTTISRFVEPHGKWKIDKWYANKKKPQLDRLDGFWFRLWRTDMLANSKVRDEQGQLHVSR